MFLERLKYFFRIPEKKHYLVNKEASFDILRRCLWCFSSFVFLPPLKDRKGLTYVTTLRSINTHMKKANWTYFLFGFPKYSKNNSLQYKDAHCLFFCLKSIKINHI